MSDESTKKDDESKVDEAKAEEAKAEAKDASDEKADKDKDGAEPKAEADETDDEAVEAKDAKAEPAPKASLSEKPAKKADSEPPAKAHYAADADDGHAEHGHGHGDHGPAYDDQGPLVAEPDRPRAGIITAVTLGIMLTVAVSCALIWSYYTQRFHAEVEAKQGAIEDPALRDLRAMETARLTKYQWVNQTAGVVRIPVVRAKELVLKDYQKAAPYTPKPPVSLDAPKPAKVEEPAPVPAPEPAPATSGSAAPAPSTSTAPAPSGSAKHQH